MKGPPHISDLNPIVHSYDVLGRQIMKHHPSSASLKEVEALVIEIWNGMDQGQIRNLIL
ncbi:hypothetical protein ABEB36_008708, partial [Hypothenemus hampei]